MDDLCREPRKSRDFRSCEEALHSSSDEAILKKTMYEKELRN